MYSKPQPRDKNYCRSRRESRSCSFSLLPLSCLLPFLSLIFICVPNTCQRILEEVLPRTKFTLCSCQETLQNPVSQSPHSHSTTVTFSPPPIFFLFRSCLSRRTHAKERKKRGLQIERETEEKLVGRGGGFADRNKIIKPQTNSTRLVEWFLGS
jgi:hypothetical protein